MGLAQIILPETFKILDFVSICDKFYNPHSQFVISKDSTIENFQISPSNIAKFLFLIEANFCLNDDELMVKYIELSIQYKQYMLNIWNLNYSLGLKFKFPISTSTFPNEIQEILSMVTLIFEYDDDSMVDETIMSLLNRIFPSLGLPLVKFNFVKYISEAIHE